MLEELEEEDAGASRHEVEEDSHLEVGAVIVEAVVVGLVEEVAVAFLEAVASAEEAAAEARREAGVEDTKS